MQDMCLCSITDFYLAEIELQKILHKSAPQTMVVFFFFSENLSY